MMQRYYQTAKGVTQINTILMQNLEARLDPRPDTPPRPLNERFEGSQPAEIVEWALTESGLAGIALASAFQAEGTCVMHMATRVRPDVPVLFLETGFHFAETLNLKQELTDRLIKEIDQTLAGKEAEIKQV